MLRFQQGIINMVYTIILKSPNNLLVDRYDLDISYLRLDYQDKIKRCIKAIEKSINDKTFPNLIIDFRDD